MDAHVTESPDSPADLQDPAGGTRAASSDGPGPPRTPPHRRHRLRWAALAAAVTVLVATGTGWAFYKKLNGNIRTDNVTQHELARHESERPTEGPQDAQDILLIGSDDRGGDNGEYGEDSGTQRSDTAILLHLAADRRSATAVSIPRDLMAQIPSCTRPDGSSTKAQLAQFNWSFQFGGAACTIRTVEEMTGVRIDHHIVLDFVGFKKMVDAVDGVEVCLTKPVNDHAAHLVLPAGRQTLRGEDALGYVRARKSLGDGSDTERMGRQQGFLGALVKKVQSNGVLLNPARLYPLLDAATGSLTTDKGLASLSGLYELVHSMRGIPADRIQFLTVPRQQYRYDHNRDELVQPDADKLFARLRTDRPVTVQPPESTADGVPTGAGQTTAPDRKATAGTPGDGASDGPGESKPPSPADAGPAFPGTTADHGVCG
ncbi:LCP family protein [Streptomyces celluloflavus]|nr:LCP family protein [Streptomyces celluloflavus]